MEHKDTQKYDSDTMKMPKKEKEKKKKTFVGICRNLELITVSEEGQIKEILQHMPSRGD